MNKGGARILSYSDKTALKGRNRGRGEYNGHFTKNTHYQCLSGSAHEKVNPVLVHFPVTRGNDTIKRLPFPTSLSNSIVP